MSRCSAPMPPRPHSALLTACDATPGLGRAVGSWGAGPAAVINRPLGWPPVARRGATAPASPDRPSPSMTGCRPVPQCGEAVARPGGAVRTRGHVRSSIVNARTGYLDEAPRLHCLLNQNTRYAGGATRPGAIAEAVHELVGAGYGIHQLPCPERLAWGGVLKQSAAPRQQGRTAVPHPGSSAARVRAGRGSCTGGWRSESSAT